MSIDLLDRGIETVMLRECTRPRRVGGWGEGLTRKVDPGWVRTGMTKGNGLMEAEESAAGLIKILEKEGMNGRWFDVSVHGIGRGGGD